MNSTRNNSGRTIHKIPPEHNEMCLTFPINFKFNQYTLLSLIHWYFHLIFNHIFFFLLSMHLIGWIKILDDMI